MKAWGPVVFSFVLSGLVLFCSGCASPVPAPAGSPDAGAQAEPWLPDPPNFDRASIEPTTGLLRAMHLPRREPDVWPHAS